MSVVSTETIEREPYCESCGAVQGRPHHDPIYEHKYPSVKLHMQTFRGQKMRVCTLCRDGAYAIKRHERRQSARKLKA